MTLLGLKDTPCFYTIAEMADSNADVLRNIGPPAAKEVDMTWPKKASRKFAFGFVRRHKSFLQNDISIAITMHFSASRCLLRFCGTCQLYIVGPGKNLAISFLAGPLYSLPHLTKTIYFQEYEKSRLTPIALTTETVLPYFGPYCLLIHICQGISHLHLWRALEVRMTFSVMGTRATRCNKEKLFLDGLDPVGLPALGRLSYTTVNLSSIRHRQRPSALPQAIAPCHRIRPRYGQCAIFISQKWSSAAPVDWK